MARHDAAKAALEAADHLDDLARSGSQPIEVASEVEVVTVRWWWEGLCKRPACPAVRSG